MAAMTMGLSFIQFPHLVLVILGFCDGLGLGDLAVTDHIAFIKLAQCINIASDLENRRSDQRHVQRMH
jgi:hypothetical protein